MSYYDNGPYLKSLENTADKSNSSALIIGLVVCLVIASGTAIAVNNRLKQRNVQLALMQKEVQTFKDIRMIEVEKSSNKNDVITFENA
jgi:hypothetical protein